MSLMHWCQHPFWVAREIPSHQLQLVAKRKKEIKKLKKATEHSGFKWLKPSKNKFTWCDFTKFPKQVSANSLDFHFRSLHAFHIQNSTNCCRNKHNQSISRIFWIFWILFLAGFCNLAQLFAARWSRGLQKKTNVHTRFSLKMSSAWH